MSRCCSESWQSDSKVYRASINDFDHSHLDTDPASGAIPFMTKAPMTYAGFSVIRNFRLDSTVIDGILLLVKIVGKFVIWNVVAPLEVRNFRK